MQLHADLTKRAVIDSATLDWVPSPLAGVERRMLERDGDEVARATTIVRYAPESYFDPHVHALGEEYVVLEGTFSDEHGDFGKGFYVRNPPGSRHRPHSKDGCTILVKLRQMDPSDTAQVNVDTNAGEYVETGVPGLTLLEVHKDEREQVGFFRFAPGTKIPLHKHIGGEEFFVIEGSLSDANGTYTSGTWVRQEHGSSHEVISEEGCVLYSKSGHLPR
jgi:anti-sigma factor ChrR (cupin superfamily)